MGIRKGVQDVVELTGDSGQEITMMNVHDLREITTISF